MVCGWYVAASDFVDACLWLSKCIAHVLGAHTYPSLPTGAICYFLYQKHCLGAPGHIFAKYGHAFSLHRNHTSLGSSFKIGCLLWVLSCMLLLSYGRPCQVLYSHRLFGAVGGVCTVPSVVAGQFWAVGPPTFGCALWSGLLGAKHRPRAGVYDAMA